MATTPNRNWPTPDDTDLVRDGASAIRALGDAIDGTVGQGFVFAGTRYYTSSGQFLKADPLGTGDIGLRAIRVRMVGGGGGGGGVATTSGGQSREGTGGGGGAYGEVFITDIASLDSSIVVERGAGGTAGPGASGTAGGTSSFGSLTVGGGDRGIGTATGSLAQVNGGAGGASFTGDFDLTVAGNAGQATYRFSPTVCFPGHGGGSFFAGDNFIGQTTTGTDGVNGTDAGQGGTGGGNAQNQGTQRAGGAGGNGIVIIDCFV